MQRLIDADAYEHAVQGNPYVSDSMKTYVRCSIQSQPTIDAVPKEKILLFLNIANEELSKAHADKSMNGIMTWSASVTTLEGLLKEYDTEDTDIVEERRMMGYEPALKDTEPRWIPCSERLPEAPFGCLVTVEDEEPMTGALFPNLLPYFVGWDGEQWNDADGEQCPFEVLAWMPLPKPYEVENDEIH